MSISVHPFNETELEAVDEVIKAAYNVQESRKESLRRYLALQPGGSFVAEQNDAMIGFGGAIDYGPFSYLGLMCVHPSMQNRGIGGLLLDHLLAWLDARGGPTVLLDTTADNLKTHTSAGSLLVRNMLTELQEHLRLVYRPAFDPDANRIEWLWRVSRRIVTHNHHRSTFELLLAAVEQHFQALAQVPAEILRHIGSPFAPQKDQDVPLSLAQAA